MTIDSNLNGKDFLDGFSTSLTALLKHGLERIFGPGADKLVVGSVTWADLGVMLCFILIVLLLKVVAAGYVRHQVKQAARKTEDKKLKHHVFGALGKPLYVLIWIYGIYFAATPLLLKLNPEEGLNLVREIFNKVFDLGVFAILFWLFFRFTHVLEVQLSHWTAKSDSKLDDLFVPLVGKSLRVIVPVVGIIFALFVLATSADSGQGWDLRCEIREKLISYIQKHHPQSLPRFRTQIGGEKSGLLTKP